MLRRLPNRLGEHPARTSGEGIEFAGVREYVPGDRQRSINWPASTRRGRLQVNTFAAERSQDVVLLVDATSDVGDARHIRRLTSRCAAPRPRPAPTLDARDRVGVITYQWGEASWLAPGSAGGRYTGSSTRCWPAQDRGVDARRELPPAAARRAAARRAGRGVQPAA